MGASPVAPQSKAQGFFGHLAGWWHVYGSVVTAMAVAGLPAAQAVVSAHPAVATALGMIATVAAKLSKSPLDLD